MGSQHKLLLPWGSATVIDQVLRAWTESLVTRIFVVVRKDDPGLQEACQRWPNVDLVIPGDDPPDMRRSVELGLEQVAAVCSPENSDRWMVAPADLPTLTSSLINRIIETSRDSDSIVVPRFGDRRGHPISVPWAIAPEVFAMSVDQGINSLLAIHPVQWLELPANEYPDDIDTPTDYVRLSKEQAT